MRGAPPPLGTSSAVGFIGIPTYTLHRGTSKLPPKRLQAALEKCSKCGATSRNVQAIRCSLRVFEIETLLAGAAHTTRNLLPPRLCSHMYKNMYQVHVVNM